MTPAEAIELIKKVAFSVENEIEEIKASKFITALKTGIEALEKQIPKKPIVEDSKDYEGYIFDIAYRCPKCNRVVCFDSENDIEEAYPYCNCGQALDWSDTK